MWLASALARGQGQVVGLPQDRVVLWITDGARGALQGALASCLPRQRKQLELDQEPPGRAEAWPSDPAPLSPDCRAREGLGWGWVGP